MYNWISEKKSEEEYIPLQTCEVSQIDEKQRIARTQAVVSELGVRIISRILWPEFWDCDQKSKSWIMLIWCSFIFSWNFGILIIKKSIYAVPKSLQFNTWIMFLDQEKFSTIKTVAVSLLVAISRNLSTTMILDWDEETGGYLRDWC